MTETRSVTRNHNRDDNASSSSRKKRFKTCDNGGLAPLSELNHDVLFLVMMKLRVVDFVAFGGVCKSWRSLTLANKKKFMASIPPMSISCISNSSYMKECYCYLEDFEGRRIKTLLPHSAKRTCVGLTCGYLVFYGEITHDVWLVNPIARHYLRFPAFPCLAYHYLCKAIFVFSQVINRRVFVVLDNYNCYKIWFCIEGKGAWNHVPSTFSIIDLHVFQGKIYALNSDRQLCEMRLSPEPKLTLLAIKNFPKVLSPSLVSSDEKLFVMDCSPRDPDRVHELDFDEMKWVSPKEKTIGEYAFFRSDLRHWTAIKPELWVVPRSQYKRYDFFRDKCRKSRFLISHMWYLPHRCLNVDSVIG